MQQVLVVIMGLQKGLQWNGDLERGWPDEKFGETKQVSSEPELEPGTGQHSPHSLCILRIIVSVSVIVTVEGPQYRPLVEVHGRKCQGRKSNSISTSKALSFPFLYSTRIFLHDPTHDHSSIRHHESTIPLIRRYICSQSSPVPVPESDPEPAVT